MNIEEHPEEGFAVWLSKQELETLVEQPDGRQRRIALKLGGYCGLRSAEVTDVCPKHVRDTQIGYVLEVPDGKDDKYREVPIKESLATQIAMYGDMIGSDDQPVIDVTTRTLRNWAKDTVDVLADDTDNHRWQYLSFHDLRRTWATHLSNAGVDSKIAMQWGGWSNLETFLDHYQGSFSPEAQREARAKIDFL